MALRRLHLPNTAVAARSGRPFLLKRQLRTCTTCAPQQMALHHPAGAVGTTHFSSSSTSNGASGAVGVSASLTALHRPDVWSGELPLAAVKRADAVRQSLLSLLRSATPPYLSVLHFNRLLMETMGLSEETPVNNGAIEGVVAPRPFKVAEMDAACLAAAWKVISLHCYFSAETSGSATAVTDHIGGAAPLTSEFIASLRVVPLDWRAALQNVAKEVPYEGWTEAELMSRLHHQYPVLVKYPLFRPNGFVGTLSAPSLCVGVWVQKNLSSLLLVTRSAVTGQLLYHNASSNGVSVIWQPMGPLTSSTSDMTAPPGDDPLFCAAIQHALHAVGRGKQLPVWTEVGAINPLLPSSLGITASGGGSAAWQRRYDSSAMLQQLFHLSSYIHIRAAEAVQQTCVVVDTFTLSPAEVKAMAVHHSAFCPKAGFAVKLMMRRAMEKETMRQKRQSYLDAFASSTAVAEVVFVDAPLEPVHMLGAVVELYATGGGASTSSALRSNNSKDVMSATAAPAGPQEGPRVSSDNEKASRMLVMCGESQRGCFEDILKDVATPNVKESTRWYRDVAARLLVDDEAGVCNTLLLRSWWSGSRESKEQIALVQDEIVGAVARRSVVPQRLALAVAQRFTAERIDTVFPVLCLLDAMLIRSAAAAKQSTVTAEEQALTAVLAELWPVVRPMFSHIHDVGEAQPALRTKCLRVVSRWGQRRLLPEDVASALLQGIEKGSAPATASSASLHPSEAGENGSSSGGERSVSGGSTADFTAVEADAFQTILSRCMSLLETLPSNRSRLYVDLIRSQHYSGPNRTAFGFFKEVLGELLREVEVSTSAISGSGLGEATRMRGSDTAAAVDLQQAGHARAALGKLLDQLDKSSSDGGSGEGQGWVSGGSSRASLAAASPNAVPLRYNSPLFSDIYAKQPLGQRVGFGVLDKRSASGGPRLAEPNMALDGSGALGYDTQYYPKREANAQRPFRVPAAKQAHGGAVRLWFPTAQEWVAAVDMADIDQYAGRRAATIPRKRDRDAG